MWRVLLAASVAAEPERPAWEDRGRFPTLWEQNYGQFVGVRWLSFHTLPRRLALLALGFRSHSVPEA